MLHGFARCDMHEFVDQSTRLFLALRRVDEEVTRWWHEEMSGKDITCATWHDFNNFCVAVLCLLVVGCLVPNP